MLFQRKVDKLSSWQDKASKDLASAAPATPAEALAKSIWKRPAPQVRLRPPELCVKAILSATTLPGSCRHCQAVAYAQHRTTLTASSLTRLLSPKWGPSRWICKLMQTACRTKEVHDKIRPHPDCPGVRQHAERGCEGRSSSWHRLVDPAFCPPQKGRQVSMGHMPRTCGSRLRRVTSEGSRWKPQPPTRANLSAWPKLSW